MKLVMFPVVPQVEYLLSNPPIVSQPNIMGRIETSARKILAFAPQLPTCFSAKDKSLMMFPFGSCVVAAMLQSKIFMKYKTYYYLSNISDSS